MVTMRPDDEVAIANAAQTRAQRERERDAFDAARAELPRTLSEDVREHARWWRALVRRAFRRLT